MEGPWPQDGYLLRIFIGESDRCEGRPLYEWIVREAKARGMAGATVVRGLMGFGAHSAVIHTFKIQRLSEDLPIIVEIVDSGEKVEAFLDYLSGKITRGMLATVERVQVRIYRGGRLTS